MRQDENSTLKWKNMRDGIDGQVSLLSTAIRELYAHASQALTGPVPTRVYFVGCGDSHFCGVATRYASELLTGISTEALESLEFSRYAIRTAPEGSLVVAVSNSGDVARSVEALKFARQAGLSTLAITYNEGSRLAEQGDALITYDYRDVGFGPGTMSYEASLLSLLAVIIRLAELAGRLDSAGVEAQLGRISALSRVLEHTLAASEKPARDVAAVLTDETPVFVLGGGPNYGTAMFTMAKMIESARHNTVAQQLEEWAHEQYFCCTPGTVTIVLAPPGASLDRAREQLQAIRDMRGTAVAVCSAEDRTTADLADFVLPVVGHVDEELSPLVYLAAGELIAHAFASQNDKVMLGFDDEFRKQVNFRQIFGSNIPESVLVQASL
ncbi:SIS domain-containing protein [Leifsonia sp. NPDC056665]|uniref:SIS domain-containing protein n=1 Tax=Leifsonia sp. NPDC056665 TaxID=3345901 RepID=UPI003698D25E